MADEKDSTKADVKDALLEALFAKNCSRIEAVLQQQPELVNFEYDNTGEHYTTPLLLLCARSRNELGKEDTGMLML